jgi:hypothetical protein
VFNLTVKAVKEKAKTHLSKNNMLPFRSTIFIQFMLQIWRWTINRLTSFCLPTEILSSSFAYTTLEASRVTKRAFEKNRPKFIAIYFCQK